MSPEPARHFNMCVLKSKPDIHTIYIQIHVYKIHICQSQDVPQTFTFKMGPKSRVVVRTVRVWSLSRQTFLWLASWANAYRAFPTITGVSVPQARTSVTE